MEYFDLERAVQRDIEPPVILLEEVTKDYAEGQHALSNLNLEIRKGEFAFIVGSSGSGKSTLIKLLIKEITPTKGHIMVAGKELSRLRSHNICKLRRSIGAVFQDFRLLEERTVYDNVAFAMRVIGAPKFKIKSEVPRILSIMGLGDKMDCFPSELSGGEQQRVALARALVNNPVILLADEPTGNLDPKNSWEIMHLLEEINRRGTTVLVVTHNREIVDRMQKRVITLNKGILVGDKKGGYSNAKNQ